MGMNPSFETHASADIGLTVKQTQSLRAYVQSVIDDWAVPGAAVAVVQNEHIILAEGFGYRDLERRWPVTPTTQFGIGSSTKAFTAMAFQMLVDDGKLSWTRPVRETIPEFRMHDLWITEHVSALDFAVHRSGLPRHDALWMFNPEGKKFDFISVAEHLEPAAPFRTEFIYNNFGYIVLGHMIETVVGQSWQDLVTQRILQPLSMQSTTFSIASMQRSSDFSLAYVDIDGALAPLSPPELGAGAPAGAINATVLDMAQWLKLNLNGGRLGDKALINPASLRKMHSPHTALPDRGEPEVKFPSYGLGWIIDAYRGHVRVHHGGNTLGFSAQVAFIPSQEIGVVVLTNAMGTPLPHIIANQVIDTVLNLDPIDWSRSYKALEETENAAEQAATVDTARCLGTSPSHALEAYTGAYDHPGYGKLQIKMKEGRMVALYCNATIPLTHWHFDQFRGQLHPLVPVQVPFFFETDGDGAISQVNVGLEPMIKPMPFRRRGNVGLKND